MELIVNGQRIDEGLLEQEFSAIKAHYESLAQVSCCERDDEFRGYAEDNVIAKALLMQEAERGVEAPPEAAVDAALAKLVADCGGEEQFYLQVGLTPEQEPLIRGDLANNLKVETLVDRVCDGLAEPGEAGLRAFYEANLERFMTVAEVRALHLFKSIDRSERREEIYAELCEVRRRARAGEDFLELAKVHSDKPEEEIDLGFFKRGDLLDEFEIIAFSLEEGEVGPVFATPFGFHLAKVTARRPSVAKPFDEVRAEVLEAAVEEAKEQRLNAFIDELKGRATIERIEDPEPAEGDPGAGGEGWGGEHDNHGPEAGLAVPDFTTFARDDGAGATADDAAPPTERGS